MLIVWNKRKQKSFLFLHLFILYFAWILDVFSIWGLKPIRFSMVSKCVKNYFHGFYTQWKTLSSHFYNEYHVFFIILISCVWDVRFFLCHTTFLILKFYHRFFFIFRFYKVWSIKWHYNVKNNETRKWKSNKLLFHLIGKTWHKMLGPTQTCYWGLLKTSWSKLC